jgi:hypothetical protein
MKRKNRKEKGQTNESNPTMSSQQLKGLIWGMLTRLQHFSNECSNDEWKCRSCEKSLTKKTLHITECGCFFHEECWEKLSKTDPCVGCEAKEDYYDWNDGEINPGECLNYNKEMLEAFKEEGSIPEEDAEFVEEGITPSTGFPVLETNQNNGVKGLVWGLLTAECFEDEHDCRACGESLTKKTLHITECGCLYHTECWEEHKEKCIMCPYKYDIYKWDNGEIHSGEEQNYGDKMMEAMKKEGSLPNLCECGAYESEECADDCSYQARRNAEDEE